MFEGKGEGVKSNIHEHLLLVKAPYKRLDRMNEIPNQNTMLTF
jgi:hypothetical protein